MKRSGRTGLRISTVACFLIVLTLHVATSPIFVQGALTGTVSGRILDEYGHGMKNVEISVYSGEAYVKTGSTSSDGSFNVTLDVGSSYTLHFSKAGYAKVTKTASVTYYQETIKLGNIVLLKALRLSYYVLSLVANPGDTLMLPFTVSNVGEEPEEVEFLVTKPEGWSTKILGQVGEVTKINLLAGASLDLQLEILVPRTADGDNRLSLTAAGKTSSTLDLTVRVGTGGIDSAEAKITCAEPWQVVSTGSTAAFELIVTNNVEDDVYLLYINNPSLPNENWTVSFYSGTKEVRSIGVERYQSSLVTLLVDIPEDASSADYPFRIYAAGSYSITSLVLAVTVRSVPRGLDLVYPFQSRTALIGQELSYPIKVVNEGEQDERIFLGVNRTSDLMVWDISFSKEELMLPPKGGEWITLNVKSPGIVGAGIYTMNVTASTEDGEIKKVIPIVTEIVAQYLLEITDIQPINPQVASGERIDVIVTVRNIGQSPLTRIRLKVNSTGISNIFTTPIDVLALEPLESVRYFVSISPDTRLTPGGYLIEVQAASIETESSLRAFVLSVVSAIPWFWIYICLTIIATALAVIVIQRYVSKYGIKIRLRR